MKHPPERGHLSPQTLCGPLPGAVHDVVPVPAVCLEQVKAVAVGADDDLDAESPPSVFAELRNVLVVVFRLRERNHLTGASQYPVRSLPSFNSGQTSSE